VDLKLLKENCVKIRKAQGNEIQEIHKVLLESFKPYKKYYTEEAYKATVISPGEIEKRLRNKNTEVLVAIYNNKIVGTASIKIKGKRELYISSMAVIPSLQGKGIGWRILEEINRLAKQKYCRIISLESSEPLKKAVNVYEKFKFRRTGKKRRYHGIIIFEMTKEIN
jgi:ribosomal protein S18 acetylase RimI-like enzyme